MIAGYYRALSHPHVSKRVSSLLRFFLSEMWRPEHLITSLITPCQLVGRQAEGEKACTGRGAGKSFTTRAWVISYLANACKKRNIPRHTHMLTGGDGPASNPSVCRVREGIGCLTDKGAVMSWRQFLVLCTACPQNRGIEIIATSPPPWQWYMLSAPIRDHARACNVVATVPTNTSLRFLQVSATVTRQLLINEQ